MNRTAALVLCSALALIVEIQNLPADDPAQVRSDAVIVRALERMKGFDYRSHDQVRQAVHRHIDRSQGTPEFIGLVKRFQPAGIEKKLLVSLLADDRSAAVEAAELLLEMDAGRRQVRNLISDDSQAVGVIETLGLLGNGRANHLLSEVASDQERIYEPRRTAVAGLARTKPGQQKLLELVKAKTLVGDTHLVAGALLSRSQHADVRNAASKLLPQPAQKDAKPLPPIDELAKMNGDAANGLKLFRGKGTCSNCHIVDKFGKDVGPNLSEIGSKLSREAMLTSILAPSAGISHNYENYSVLTEDGQVITGLKVSETDSQVVIRTAEAIDRKLSKDDVVTLKKSDKSIMPENLHHITGQQGMLDVVEYMTTLRKKS